MLNLLWCGIPVSVRFLHFYRKILVRQFVADLPICPKNELLQYKLSLQESCLKTQRFEHLKRKNPGDSLNGKCVSFQDAGSLQNFDSLSFPRFNFLKIEKIFEL